jgi:hypothetical protein
MKLPHKLQASETWEPQVGQDDVTLVFVAVAQALVPAVADRDLEPVLLENIAQVCRQAGVVFNE